MFKVFSQRDSRWANKNLGKTNRTMAQVGCTTTCISMSGTYFEEDILPFPLCQELEYTKDALLIWSSIGKVFKRIEFDYRYFTFNQLKFDEALKSPNKTLLLNVDNGGHWVLALRRLYGNTWWVADPWTGTRKIYRGAIGGAVIRKKI
jgi:hypothetical protein